ncbi:hypothetical protein KSB_76490 [Ktedonobacter robiniae]|uniref:Uncharacterized protein n=1 Tax=Ktedonobacter robiniae TaxID=2778365 RepID=A0ABQ3V1Z8_9CHLR|nr:hypothetical protein KSB_76490 [Ktedonobacter robiniae]
MRPLQSNQSVDVAALFDFLSQGTQFGTTGGNKRIEIGFKGRRRLIGTRREAENQVPFRFLLGEDS